MNSSEAKNSLRSRITRRMLWEALFSLLEEKYFSQITIQDICARAEVNRSTFYHHFESKYDLLNYGISTVIPKQAGLDKRLPAEGESWSEQGPHTALFAYVKTHQRFWNNLLVKEGFSEEVLTGMLEGTKSFLEEIYTNTDDDETASEIAAQMYIGAVGNLTIWWLRQGCEMPIQQLNSYVDAMWRYPKKTSLKSRKSPEKA